MNFYVNLTTSKYIFIDHLGFELRLWIHKLTLHDMARFPIAVYLWVMYSLCHEHQLTRKKGFLDTRVTFSYLFPFFFWMGNREGMLQYGPFACCYIWFLDTIWCYWKVSHCSSIWQQGFCIMVSRMLIIVADLLDYQYYILYLMQGIVCNLLNCDHLSALVRQPSSNLCLLWYFSDQVVHSVSSAMSTDWLAG